MTDITQQLKTLFENRLKENESLAKHVNYRIGGPARWFVEAKTSEEIAQAVKIAQEADITWFVLGGGSNTLVSDEGIDGLVIKMTNRKIEIKDSIVVAEAGVITAVLARKTASAGLAGFEWAISIPGTIGGAIRGNAGCFGGEVKDVVTSVRVLRDGQVVDVPVQEMKFAYRESVIKHNNDIVLSVTMKLQSGEVETLKKKLDETLAKRKETQPLDAGSAGCIFKNYKFDNEDDLQRLKQDADVPEGMLKSGTISAGWLIEQMGLKGKKIGGAMISEEHGNFLINLGDATASDIVQLISAIKMDARDRFGIQLQEEIQYLGF